MSLSGNAVFAVGVVQGIVAERSFSGLIQSLARFKGKQEGNKDNTISVLMIAFNFSLICLVVVFTAQYAFDGRNCLEGQLAINVLSHLVYGSFGEGNNTKAFTDIMTDAFICYKTYLYSNLDARVQVVALLLLIARVAAAGLDISQSYGVWDGEICYYYQWPDSGIIYNSLDIAVDLFSTCASVTFASAYLEWDFTRIGEIIISENVLRSSVMLTANSFAIYGANQFTDPFPIFLTFSTQSLAYACCLNSESFWKEWRHKSFKAKSNFVPALRFEGKFAIRGQVERLQKNS
ncbi:hypothetical protein BC830DRAFT_1080024 [Chytriomyces sp. MP71]|nr:hypothetical protein BC830DRAFT_1080024 [Chytriomyces sp. MP71]